MKMRLFALMLLCIHCEGRPKAVEPRPLAQEAAAGLDLSLRKRWLELEARQVHPKLEVPELNPASIEELRLAARAVARLSSVGARAYQEQLLRSDDPEVSGWSAFGLGLGCEGQERPTVEALALAAARVASRRKASAEQEAFLERALADALGRCGDRSAERTLLGLLETGAAREAAAGLLRLSSVQGQFEEATLVALVHRAGKEGELLDALSRQSIASGPVADELLELLRAVLREKSSVNALPAVRALSALGAAGASDLEAVLLDRGFALAVRAEAQRGLLKLGVRGQKALVRLLEKASDQGWLSELTLEATGELALGLSALDALERPAPSLKAALQAWSTPALEGASEGARPSPTERRQILLACAAAAVLAEGRSQAGVLKRCAGPYQTPITDLAILRVLGRGPVAGARLKVLEQLFSSAEPRVRRGALELLAQAETEGQVRWLERGLTSAEDGLVAAAAGALAERARVANASELVLPPELGGWMARAFKGLEPASVEARMLLMEAARGHGVLSLLPELERYCEAPYAALRRKAELELRLFGQRERSCDVWQEAPSPPELEQLVTRPVTVLLDTDIGVLELQLDPRYAPLAVSRVVSLVKAKRFDNMAIHRAVPGFAVQFGDPDGDGYGGMGEPLMSELAPVPFAALEVGMAAAGRDAGTSQVFVTLASAPHLQGEFAWLGRASGPWERLLAGDVILRASVKD